LDPESAAHLIAAAADVALIVDEDGVIRDMAYGNEEMAREGGQEWVGKPWTQTVSVESRIKVEQLLRDAISGAGTKWRHINQVSVGGADLPLLFSAVRVGGFGKSAGSGRAVAFGRDLRSNMALQQRLLSAQQAMERDYWRLRHMETRYRLLFQVAAEAVLILDSGTQKLEEANPAAQRLFGDAIRRPNWSLLESFDPESTTTVEGMLAGVRATGRPESVQVRLAGGGEPCTVSASLFRQEKSAHFLVRLVPMQASTPNQSRDVKLALLHLVEAAPDAFVVTDLDGRILTVNRAFLDLAQLATEEQVRNASLDKWLGRTGVDLSVLISNLRQRGAVRLFSTVMRGEYGSNTDVEISAVAVETGDLPCLGFTIRDVGRRLTPDARASRELPRSVGQMTELVGRVPLKDIVRDTTDLIEQLCIEAALELTRDNRASAAEMLGLSRQSLYVKLRRFGLGELAPDTEE
jgi:transcriptional regulator PpsR